MKSLPEGPSARRATPLLAQAPKDVTVAWAYSDEAEAATKMPSFVWTSGGDLLLLDETKPAATRTIERVKAGTGARVAAVDRAAALASLKGLVAAADMPEALPWPEAFDAGGPGRGLRDRRRSLRSGPRVLALRAADADGRRREHSAALAGRAQGRLRARQRSLRLRPRDEARDAADLGREPHDPERRPVLGVLGGDLRPRHGRVLVVGRLLRDRVPAHATSRRSMSSRSRSSRPPCPRSSRSATRRPATRTRP